MTVLLAVALGLLIGLSLGALGGGGSILTVPALVYALGETAQSATTGSLVIVGITAAAAAVGHARAGRVRWRAGLAFGAAGVAASLVGTQLNARVQPGVLLVAFALLMLVAAAAMLVKTMVATSPDERRGGRGMRQGTVPPAHEPGAPQPETRTPDAASPCSAGARRRPRRRLPDRVPRRRRRLHHRPGARPDPAVRHAHRRRHLAGRHQPQLRGRTAARGGQDNLHWAVIIPFTLAAIAGSFAGKQVADRVSGPHLTRGFAVLLLAVAGYVLLQAGLSNT